MWPLARHSSVIPNDLLTSGSSNRQHRTTDWALTHDDAAELSSYRLGDPSPLCSEQVSQLWAALRRKASIGRLAEEQALPIQTSLQIACACTSNVSLEQAAGMAAVLAEFNVTVPVITAAVLLETVAAAQSTDSSLLAALRGQFGDAVVDASLAYRRLPVFAPRSAYTAWQAEHQLQMLVTCGEGEHWHYLRLADRLHYLRSAVPSAARTAAAQEALHVYAPLAHHMGLMHIKARLEDQAFSIVQPEAFSQVRAARHAVKPALFVAVRQISLTLRQHRHLLQAVGVEVSHRIKTSYQIHLKMHRKQLACAAAVRDIAGIRVLLDTSDSSLCYEVAGMLRNMTGWSADMPNSYKDYIARPKDSGYGGGLHLYLRCLTYPSMIVEVQVCTLDMHHAAELGQSAHWFYKDMLHRPEVARSKLYRLAWRSAQQMTSSFPQALALAKHQLQARVFVLLADRSTVLNLKQSSTALDAAFAIHRNVGLRAEQILINGTPAAFNTRLCNGDVISVATSAAPTACIGWMAVVTGRRSRSSLRRYLRQHRREEAVAKGLMLMLRCIREEGRALSAEQLVRQAERMGCALPELLLRLALRPDPSALLQRLLRGDHPQHHTSSGEGCDDDQLLRDLLPLLGMTAAGLRQIMDVWAASAPAPGSAQEVEQAVCVMS